MSKTKKKTVAVPKFYRDLGKDAVTAYRLRKTCKHSTKHFSRIYGNVKYVFWETGYDEWCHPFPMQPYVDRLIKKMEKVALDRGITTVPVSKSLSVMSINKPGN